MIEKAFNRYAKLCCTTVKHFIESLEVVKVGCRL